MSLSLRVYLYAALVNIVSLSLSRHRYHRSDLVSCCMSEFLVRTLCVVRICVALYHIYRDAVSSRAARLFLH